MKRMTKLFLILTIGLLVSCSNDDNAEPNAFQSDIIGTWELFSFTANGDEFIDNLDCLDTLTFTATTLISTEYYDYGDGNGCVVDYVSDAGTYSITGNMLTGTVDGDTVTFEIVELNATTLKLSATITEGNITYTFVETFNKV